MSGKLLRVNLVIKTSSKKRLKQQKGAHIYYINIY